MANLAIVPARGGSKRVPGKNTRPLGGRPVISYPIAAALGSGLFDEVMVSTDDEAIAAIARDAGANVPFLRSVANSGDHATLAEVLAEVIGEYSKTGRSFTHVCCILPTAALVSADRIREGFEKMGEANSLVTVLRYGAPIQRALKAENGVLTLREPQFINTRTQDLEPFYHDAAQFYWIRTEALMRERRIFTARTAYLELQESEAQDVDSASDWELLRMKFESRQGT